jgi:hypothetical protein
MGEYDSPIASSPMRWRWDGAYKCLGFPQATAPHPTRPVNKRAATVFYHLMFFVVEYFYDTQLCLPHLSR